MASLGTEDSQVSEDSQDSLGFVEGSVEASVEGSVEDSAEGSVEASGVVFWALLHLCLVEGCSVE